MSLSYIDYIMTLLLITALFRLRRRRLISVPAVILLGLAAISCPRAAVFAEAPGVADGARAGAYGDAAFRADTDTGPDVASQGEDGGADEGAELGSEPGFGEALPLAAEPMEPFFEALARMERTGAGHVRVLHYGDSHTAADLLTAAMRRAFQDRFGDGGRGFVHLGKPWKSYRPKDVKVAESFGDWRAERILVAVDPAALDGRYGLPGVCTIGARRGAFVRVGTAESGEYGREAASFDIFYLIQRGGGSFDVRVDGRVAGRVRTDGPGPHSGFYRVEAKPGLHAIEVRLRGDGEVRLFGVAVEAGRPGVVYDGLGVNGAFFYTPLRWDGALLAEQIERRDPDLIIAMYGSNEVDSRTITRESYRADVRRVMERFREGAPEASCLLVGPPDRRPRDAVAGVERLAWINDVQREVADEIGCGFIDLLGLMGGAGSRAAWERQGLAQPDGVHLTARGYRVVGERLVDEIVGAYEDFREGNPLAGAE